MMNIKHAWIQISIESCASLILSIHFITKTQLLKEVLAGGSDWGSEILKHPRCLSELSQLLRKCAIVYCSLKDSFAFLRKCLFTCGLWPLKGFVGILPTSNCKYEVLGGGSLLTYLTWTLYKTAWILRHVEYYPCKREETQRVSYRRKRWERPNLARCIYKS